MSSLSGVPVDSGNITRLREILEMYNQVTHICFQRCVTNLNQRSLTPDEETCLNHCSGKHVGGNNRIIAKFMEINNEKEQRMRAESEAKQAAVPPPAVPPPPTVEGAPLPPDVPTSGVPQPTTSNLTNTTPDTT